MSISVKAKIVGMKGHDLSNLTESGGRIWLDVDDGEDWNKVLKWRRTHVGDPLHMGFMKAGLEIFVPDDEGF